MFLKFEDFLKESNYQSFGASDSDERKAAQGNLRKNFNASKFAKATAFKRALSEYIFTKDVKDELGRIIIQAGSKSFATVKVKVNSYKDLMKSIESNVKRFEKVYNINLKISEKESGKFTFEYN